MEDENRFPDRPRYTPPRRRDRFVLPSWAWAVIGVVCLLLGMVIGALLWKLLSTPTTPSPTVTANAATATPHVVVVTATPGATATAAPATPALPTATPTPVPTDTPAPTATPTAIVEIQVGGKVRVTDTGGADLRLRAGPGLDFVTFKMVEEGEILEVLGGPEKGDNYIWWRLRDATGAIGWAAQDFLAPVP